MSNEAKRKKFVAMRAKGVPFKKIASDLGVPVDTLVEWSFLLVDEVSNLKAIEIEARDNPTFLNRTNRVELLQTIVEKLRDELEKRDFSQIPTEKLVALLPKLAGLLRSEERKVKLRETSVKSLFENDFMTTTEVQSWDG